MAKAKKKTFQIGGSVSKEAHDTLVRISKASGISKIKLIDKAIIELANNPKIQAAIDMMS